MADIVFFGTGQSAEVGRVYLESYSEHRVVGYTVDPKFVTSETFQGLPLAPWDRLEEFFPPSQVELLGPISYWRMNEFRRDRFLEGKARHYRFASFVHPESYINTTDIGEHCFILESNIIEPFAKIGNNVVIWGGSHIGHHAVIEDDCFLSARVGVSARARVGRRSFLAIKVIVAPGVTVGEASMLGLNVAVQTDVAAESVITSDQQNRIAKVPSSRLRRLV
ncbi:MAG: hypothetical protein OER43_10820 [Gammaproteobacteria bacterium]|nr:hypothetical protein [Gammaproteobacteria bacterium]MDH3413512.1 hypothetical protein [Gammaproteobacteria bacterium]